MSRLDPEHPALRLEFTDSGEAELDEGFEFMVRFGYQTAENWLAGIEAELDKETRLQAALPMRRSPAPEYFPGRDVYVLQYTTRGGSPWRLLCELVDVDKDGVIDTLRLVGVRHTARSGSGDVPASDS